MRRLSSPTPGSYHHQAQSAPPAVDPASRSTSAAATRRSLSRTTAIHPGIKRKHSSANGNGSSRSPASSDDNLLRWTKNLIERYRLWVDDQHILLGILGAGHGESECDDEYDPNNEVIRQRTKERPARWVRWIQRFPQWDAERQAQFVRLAGGPPPLPVKDDYDGHEDHSSCSSASTSGSDTETDESEGSRQRRGGGSGSGKRHCATGAGEIAGSTSGSSSKSKTTKSQNKTATRSSHPNSDDDEMDIERRLAPTPWRTRSSTGAVATADNAPAAALPDIQTYFERNPAVFAALAQMAGNQPAGAAAAGTSAPTVAAPLDAAPLPALALPVIPAGTWRGVRFAVPKAKNGPGIESDQEEEELMESDSGTTRPQSNSRRQPHASPVPQYGGLKKQPTKSTNDGGRRQSAPAAVPMTAASRVQREGVEPAEPVRRQSLPTAAAGAAASRVAVQQPTHRRASHPAPVAAAPPTATIRALDDEDHDGGMPPPPPPMSQQQDDEPIGLGPIPEVDAVSQEDREAHQRGHALLTELHDAFDNAREPLDTEGLLKLMDLFAPLVDAFDGDGIADQTLAWIEAEDAARDAMTQGYARALQKMAVIRDTATEEVMKISKAHQRKSALVEEAKEDFATIAWTQAATLHELRNKINAAHKKGAKQAKNLPDIELVRRQIKEQTLEMLQNVWMGV